MIVIRSQPCILSIVLVVIFHMAFQARADESGKSAHGAQKLGTEVLQRLIDDSAVRDGTVIDLPAGIVRIDRPLRIGDRSGITIRGGRGTEIWGSKAYKTRKLMPDERVPEGINPNTILVIDFDNDLRELLQVTAHTEVGCPSRPGLILYENEQEMTCARWPAQGYALGKLVAGSNTPRKFVIDVPPGKISSWREGNLSVGGYFSYDWYYEKAKAQLDLDRGTLVVGPTKQPYVARDGLRYMVEGGLGDFNAPGSFILDPAGSRILVVPYGNALDLPDIEIPISRGLLSLSRANGIHIEDLSFKYSLDDGIRINQSQSVTLTDVQVMHIGGAGIRVQEGLQIGIRRAVISDVGGAGAILSGGDNLSLTPGEVSLSDSVVVNTAKISKTYTPAVRLEGAGNSLRDNFICGTPHVAITFAGSQHDIEGNEITRTVSETSDAGTIYAGRSWIWRGNDVSENYLHDIPPNPQEVTTLDGSTLAPYSSDTKGVYLDDMVSGTQIKGNAFSNVQQPVFIGGGHDNIVTGNVFLKPLGYAVTIDERGLLPSFEKTMQVIRSEFLRAFEEHTQLSERYFNGATEESSGAAVGNLIQANTVVDGKLIDRHKLVRSSIMEKGNEIRAGVIDVDSDLSSRCSFASSISPILKSTVVGRRIVANRKVWATLPQFH